MSGPLSGVRVLDLSNVVSGPMAVQLLADQGADVIKIEQPEGDSCRNMGANRNGIASMFAVLNRNKRSVVLNMQHDSAKDIFKELAATADVLVQNFRPGAMARMGLDYATLSASNPRLIYANISGFGATGPYADRRVYDPVIQAITGFVSTQTGSQPGADPQLVKNILCDKATALTAAQAITAALFAREKSGEGQELDVAMVDAGLAFLWPDGMWNHTFTEEGAQPMPSLSDIYRVSRTKDGFVTYITVSDSEWAGMCRAIDREDLIKDARFVDIMSRIQNLGEVMAILTDEIEKWETTVLCERLEAEDVPFAKINALDEVHRDPQIVHRGSVVEVEHSVGGRVRMTQPVARFHASPASIRFQAPLLGEHTNEVLAELGRENEEIERLRGAGAVA